LKNRLRVFFLIILFKISDAYFEYFLKWFYKLKLIPCSWHEIVLTTFKYNLDIRGKLKLNPVQRKSNDIEDENIVFVLNNIQSGEAKVHFRAFVSLAKLILSSNEKLSCVFFISHEKECVDQLLFAKTRYSILNFETKIFEKQAKEILSETEYIRFKIDSFDNESHNIKSYFEATLKKVLSYNPKYSIFYTGAPNDSILIRSLLYNQVPIIIRYTQTRHIINQYFDYYITQNLVEGKTNEKAIFFPLNFDLSKLIKGSASIPKELEILMNGFNRVIISALSGRVFKLYSQLPLEYQTAFEKLILSSNTLLLMVGMSESEFNLFNETKVLSKLKEKGKVKFFRNIDYLPKLIDKSSLLLHHFNYPGGGWTGRICVNMKTPIMCFKYSDIPEYLNNCEGVYQSNDCGFKQFLSDFKKILVDDKYLTNLSEIQYQNYNELMSNDAKNFNTEILTKLRNQNS